MKKETKFLLIAYLIAIILIIFGCNGTHRLSKQTFSEKLDSTTTHIIQASTDSGTKHTEVKIGNYDSSVLTNNYEDDTTTITTDPILIRVDSGSISPTLPIIHQGGETFVVFSGTKTTQKTHKQIQSLSDVNKKDSLNVQDTSSKKTIKNDSLSTTVHENIHSLNKQVKNSNWEWFLLFLIPVYFVYKYRKPIYKWIINITKLIIPI